MSTNIQDGVDLANRKRCHDDFVEEESCAPLSADHVDDGSMSDKENDARCTPAATANSPAKSSSVLSEPASSPAPPSTHSASVTPAKSSTMLKAASISDSTGEPPKKRKRATRAEMKAREAEREAEKRRKQEEREKKQREKEEAERAKAQEKAAKQAEKAKKEQEQKQRQEEKDRKKREKEEEEAKKARSQMKLTAMFGLTAAPKKEPAAPKSDTKSAETATTKELSLYEHTFKPFFVKEHVRMAKDACQFDEEAKEAKLRILEEHISGQREAPTLRFDPVETLQLPFKPRPRGRFYPSVKKIMADLEGSDTTESQTAQMKDALEMLKKVPMKSIKFKEDVRPAYVGTVSGLPAGVQSLARLAKNPTSRKILPLNYDYDSEAEWVDEEGEDVDDLDDEEEELDGDEDMDDFLDDSEDVGPSRMVFSGGMEPEATGPCWEDRTRKTTEPKLYKYRLEFILEPLEHHHSIDPFSTAYWSSPKSKTSTSPSAPRTTTAPGTAQEARAPAPAPADAFQALNPAASATEKGTKKPVQPLPPDMQEKLKEVHRENRALSKAGVIEVFAANNPGYPKARIRATFEVVFEMTGKQRFKIKGE
ncbi:hypothetical protein VTJ49DRAFT_7065 [Mycothermus thermophilus]|uniref:Chromatin assembly factor 1 subunit A n=1 Tax=Humicola insolens TaxID=85995 RepID=A0ABR3VJ96_HUMIN